MADDLTEVPKSDKLRIWLFLIKILNKIKLNLTRNVINRFGAKSDPIKRRTRNATWAAHLKL